jgi:hypothetical protein
VGLFTPTKDKLTFHGLVEMSKFSLVPVLVWPRNWIVSPAAGVINPIELQGLPTVEPHGKPDPPDISTYQVAPRTNGEVPMSRHNSAVAKTVKKCMLPE